MRRTISIWLVAFIFAILVAEAEVAAKDLRVRPSGVSSERDEAVTNFIYDATIPWPFRHGAAGPVSSVVEDLDGDGVADSMDKCPGTPHGAVVDESGCPRDSDGDGVVDGIDMCPGTPSGAMVDASGCTGDADGDGVIDGVDTCPETPKGATVDVAGCPRDSDRDGVYDGLDKCPDTPAGARVWKDGCPMTEAQQEFLDTGVFSTTEIVFETGKADIKPQSEEVLGKIGAFLAAHNEIKVEVGGHTDSQGSEANNQTLSEQRATAIEQYLLVKFPAIQRDQLTSKGYGESTPVASNDTAEGRAKNRRVEFKLLSQ